LHNAEPDPDLAALVEAWAKLPAHIRQTITSLVRAAGVGGSLPCGEGGLGGSEE
jgi:hypothetical protein